MAYDGSLIFDTKVDTTGAKNDIGQLGSKIGSLVKGVALGYTGKTLVEYFIGSNADMETYLTSFETMLGSAEEAQSLMNNLKQMASVTPFETTDLTNATQILMSFGTEVKDVQSYLQMLGDISQGNKEKFNSLALVFGQVKSAGKLMGQDLLQFINVGFNPLQEMAKKTGRSMADLKKDMEDGKISFEMVADAMKSATSEGGLFYQAMEKQSKTMSGMLSTLKDNLAQFGRDAGEKAFGQVKDSLQGLLDMIDEASKDGTLDEIAEDIGNALNALISTLISTAKFLYEYKDAILAGVTAMVAFKSALAISNFITSAVNAYKTLKSAIDAGTTSQLAFVMALESNPIGIAVGAVAGLVAVVANAAKAYETLYEKADRLKQEADQSATKVNDLKSKVDELSQKIQELQNIGKLDITQQKDLENLQLQKKYTEELLAIEKERQKIADKKAEKAALDYINDDNGGLNGLKASIQNYKDMQKNLEEVKANFKKAVEDGDTQMATYWQGLIDNSEETMTTYEEDILLRQKNISKTMEGVKGLTEEGKTANNEFSVLNSQITSLLNVKNNGSTKSAVSEMANYYAEMGKSKLEAQQKEAEEQDTAFKESLDLIERNHARGLISDGQYYSQKSALLKKNSKEQLKDYDSFYGSMKSAQETANKQALEDTKKAQKEQVNVISDSLEKIKSEYKSQYDEIMAQQKSYADKLSSADMFSRETVGEKDNVVVLTNFQQKYEELQQYQQLLDKIRAKGASEDFTAQIKNMGVKDAVDYMNTLLSSGDIDAQFKAFEAYNDEAQKIAQDEYKNQVDNVQQNFVNEVANALNTLPEQAGKIGLDTASAFVNALTNTDMLNKIKNSLSIADVNKLVDSTRNNSNNLALTASTGKQNLRTLPTQTEQPSQSQKGTVLQVNTTVELDKKVVGKVVTDYQLEQSYTEGKKIN